MEAGLVYGNVCCRLVRFQGDVIGAGIDIASRTMFFTYNGELLTKPDKQPIFAESDLAMIATEDWFPYVGFAHPCDVGVLM